MKRRHFSIPLDQQKDGPRADVGTDELHDLIEHGHIKLHRTGEGGYDTQRAEILRYLSDRLKAQPKVAEVDEDSDGDDF